MKRRLIFRPTKLTSILGAIVLFIVVFGIVGLIYA